MKYNGKIKATFAEIRNAAGETLFSFQHTDAGNAVLVIANGQPDAASNQLIPVALTDAAVQLIDSLMTNEEHYQRIMQAMNTNDIYVKPVAWNWASDKTLIWVGAAALALLLLNKKKR